MFIFHVSLKTEGALCWPDPLLPKIIFIIGERQTKSLSSYYLSEIREDTSVLYTDVLYNIRRSTCLSALTAHYCGKASWYLPCAFELKDKAPMLVIYQFLCNRTERFATKSQMKGCVPEGRLRRHPAIFDFVEMQCEVCSTKMRQNEWLQLKSDACEQDREATIFEERNVWKYGHAERKKKRRFPGFEIQQVLWGSCWDREDIWAFWGRLRRWQNCCFREQRFLDRFKFGG